MNNAIETHLLYLDLKAILQSPSLDRAIYTYAGASIFIKKLCVPIKEDNWSILDISVLCDVHSSDNGYFQKTQFTTSTDNLDDDQIDCITYMCKYCTAWWSKYFGLNACSNGHGRVPYMYFGHGYIVVGTH